MGLPTVLRREFRPGSLLFRGRHRSHCSSPVWSGRSSNRRQAQPNSVYSELRGYLWGSWPPTRSPDRYFTFSECRLLCPTLNKHLVKSLSMYLVDSRNISYSYKTNPLQVAIHDTVTCIRKMNHTYWLFIVIIIFDFWLFFGQTIIILNICLIGYANIPNYKDIELNKNIYKIYLLSILNLEMYWQM